MNMKDAYFTMPEEFHEAIKNALYKKTYTKYWVSGVIICCCFMILFFYNNHNHSNTVFEQTTFFSENEQQESSNIPAIGFSLDLTVYYESDEEMYENSDLVVSGKIIKNESFLSSGTVFTSNQLKIEKIYKGDVSIEDVQVIEWGGYLSEKEAIEFINKEGFNSYPNGLLVNYGGYVISSPGDEIIIFLTKCEDDMITDILGKRSDLYYVAGAIQGKFVLENDYYVSYSSNNASTREKYTIKEFDTLIEQNVEK